MEKIQSATVIAENVRNLLIDRGFTNTELAKRSGISNGTISKIIHGNMNVTVPLLLSLAEGLEVGVNDILGKLSQQREKPVEKLVPPKKTDYLSIGIMSISGKRMTCIKNYRGKIIGTSELEDGLDLAEPTTYLMNLIRESIDEALPSEEIDEHRLRFTNLSLVMQSYEFEGTRAKFELFAKRHFGSVKVLPDWQVTHLAAFPDGRGISLVVEKGVSLSYIHGGRLKKLGGWKFPVYDLGGENWLGLETIHHTIEAFEGYVPMSDLAKRVLAKYGGKIEKITEACFKGTKSTDVYASFTDMLLRSYFTGDNAAKKIIEHGFNEIYKIVRRANNILDEKLSVAINGSLLDIYKPYFKQSRLVEAPTDAEKVALLAGISDELLSKFN